MPRSGPRHCLESALQFIGVHPGYLCVRFRSPFDLDVRSPSHAFLFYFITFTIEHYRTVLHALVHALKVVLFATIQ